MSLQDIINQSDTASYDDVCVRRLGVMPYQLVWDAMQAFNRSRDADTADEIWLLEHAPVYTVGLSCDAGSFIVPESIPIIGSDRGGNITYHGPGQLVAYIMVDMHRRGWGVRNLVERLEQSVIDLLAAYRVSGRRRSGAPGVYVNDCKIAALGLRVRRGCSYHGLSLNVDMDLTPFAHIDPCGYRGLAVTQLRDEAVAISADQARDELLQHLRDNLWVTESPQPGVRSVSA